MDQGGPGCPSGLFRTEDRPVNALATVKSPSFTLLPPSVTLQPPSVTLQPPSVTLQASSRDAGTFLFSLALRGRLGVDMRLQ